MQDNPMRENPYVYMCKLYTNVYYIVALTTAD